MNCKEKGKCIVFLLLFFLMAMPYVSAEILFSQPSTLYNKGDFLDLNMTLAPESATADFLSVTLECNAGSLEISKNPYTLHSGAQQNVHFSIELDPQLIGSLDGNCAIIAMYGGDSARSQSFFISSKINIQTNFGSTVMDPGTSVLITGSTRKENGQIFDGFITLSIPSLNITLTSPVNKGEFNFNIIIPLNSPASRHEVSFSAYEQGNSKDYGNKGEFNTSFTVRQIARKIVLAVESLVIIPGNDLRFTLYLHDQTDNLMTSDVKVQLIQPNGSVFISRVVFSGKSQTIPIPYYAVFGSWSIDASAGVLQNRQTVSVEKLEQASFVLANKTLTITNTGNTPYNKNIEVRIGENYNVLDVSLSKPGDKKKFKLSAPEGVYDISVLENKGLQNFGPSFLTGSAVGIKEINSSLGSKLSFIIWWLIIGLLIITLWLAYRRIARKTYTGKIPKSNFEPLRRVISNQEGTVDSKIASKRGYKADVIVIALQIKNYEKIKGDLSASGAVGRAVKYATEAKANVYNERGENTLMFFKDDAPDADRVIKAVGLARAIEKHLEEYNRMNSLKIEFGVGINRGSMILESINGKDKFTAVGNTVITAKSASNKLSSAIVISETVRILCVGKIKAEKIPESQFWKVISVRERDQHSDFINRFIGRQA